MTKPALSAHDMTLAHHKQVVVDALSLHVQAGEVFGLIGPNGAGKTTVLRALAGALRPREGNVLIDDRALRSLSHGERARAIGVVPQSETQSGALSVAEIVSLGRAAHRGWLLPLNATDRAAVESALERTGLAALRDRRISTLSGGERRLVLLARALAQEPAVLLLDEPTADLDLYHQLQVLELVRMLARESRLAAVIAIHDLTLAARYCDRLALLHRGTLIATGAPESVLTPEHLRTTYGVEASLYRDPNAQWALSYRRDTTDDR